MIVYLSFVGYLGNILYTDRREQILIHTQRISNMVQELQSTDYRKWLLYNFDNQSFQNYHNLFKALDSARTFGSVQVRNEDENGMAMFAINVEGIDAELRISNDQRRAMLNYLAENYFSGVDPDEALLEKNRQADISRNHGAVERAEAAYESDFRVKQHPKEKMYFSIRLVISLLVYAALVAVITWVIVNEIPLIVFLPFIVGAAAIYVLGFITKGLFIGLVKGSSVRITKDQYPEVFRIVEEQAQKLKIKVPEIFVTYGHFNSFVTSFTRSHILLIYSEVLETTLKGDYDVLKYVTAHELCHIRQKHLLKRKFLLPSAIIPFLALAYSRGCEYTCDRVGYQCSPKGAIEGVLVMTTGKEIYAKVNVEAHLNECERNLGFWTWLSEKFLTHPHPYKRLLEIKRFSQYN